MVEYFPLVQTISALVAGVVTVFLPCTYPMLVGYIALILGGRQRKGAVQVLHSTLWFFAGFAGTFIFFGSLAGLFGQFSQTSVAIRMLEPFFVTAGAIFFIIIGLVLMRVIPLPSYLYKIRSMKVLDIREGGWRSSIIGVIFAAGWSPCIGPVLGGILVLAASSGSVVAGALLMATFSLGMMLPLLAIALLYDRIVLQLRFAEKIMPYTSVIAGLIFILLGILFLSGHIGFLTSVGPPSFLKDLI